MSLIKKIVFVYVLLLFVTVLTTLLIFNFFIKQSFSEIEKKYIIEKVQRIKKYLDSEKDNLLNLTKDWGAWTDAWLFMQNKNPSFVENITISSYINNNLSCIVYLNPDKTVKAGGIYDNKSRKLLPPDERVIKKYMERFLEVYKNLDGMKKGLCGIVFEKNAPQIVAVYPVLKADFTGPLWGYLIMERPITEEKENFIKEVFALKRIKIENIKNLQDEISITEKLHEYEVIQLIEDFFGNPTVAIHFEEEKKLGILFEKNLFYIFIGYLCIWSAFGIISYFFTKKQITEKISNLVTDIENVKKGKAKAVKVRSKDEIGYLAQEINRYIFINKQQMYEIEKSREIYQIIAENFEGIIFVFNKEGEILFANKKFYEYLDKEKFNTSTLAQSLKEILQINKEEKIFLPEFKLTERCFISGWIIPLKEETILLLAHDITHLKIEKERLLEKALRDSLTNLHNRYFFESYFVKILDEVKKGDNYSLIFIDIDDLKKINDQFGHIAGDIVLKEFAKTLNNTIRKSDIAARWGGDEFTVILKGDINTALEVSKRIQENIKNLSFNFDDKTISFSISIGITKIDPLKNIHTLVHEADKGTYMAKKEGKDKIKIFTSTESSSGSV